MDFYIWNKQDSLMGLSANTILNSRLDFMYDNVLVIHKKGDKENIIMIESVGNLRETYDIESSDPEVIGYMVSAILMQEDQENMKSVFKDIENDRLNLNYSSNHDDYLDVYAKMLADILEQVGNSDNHEGNVPVKGSYEDPTCNIIDLSDVDEEVEDKKITVTMHHAFISEVSDATELKCMYEIKEEIENLANEIEKYINETDMEKVDNLLTKYDNLKRSVNDSCDATIKIEAKAIYDYETNVIIECANGQNIIIDKMVLRSMKTNALEYQKHNPEGGKYKVHYKTVDIDLDECCNELKERYNTVFIVSI